MIITKRLTRPIFHTPKSVFKRRFTKPSLDNKANVKVFFYGEINFLARVGCFEMVYYYGIEFNRILN